MRTLLLALVLAAASKPATPEAWVGSWACSQQIPEPQNALAPKDLENATLRQIVHLPIGGSALRVHLSNAFGSAPLTLISVSIARPRSAHSAAIDPATNHGLTFAGHADVTIPAGAEYISDPLPYITAPGDDVAISIFYRDPPERQTGHPGSRATSYIAHGNLASAPDLPGAKTVDHWYQISAIDVLTGDAALAVVTLGDSITDGHGATTNGNNRWPDILARRLPHVGVLNAGIGGNRLLDDGLGPNALARFDRDVLAQTGVRYVIVLEGVNDLGTALRHGPVAPEEHAALVRRILDAYDQLITRAHAHHLRIYGGTITPYAGSDYYHPDAAAEADRQQINAWIRAPGHFDEVVDFDKALRDPAHPDRLRPEFDSGDHLHPSPAGYAAMARAIPLAFFSH
ncbi:MAG TPA: SGNH/GDSL hydrolase family protein [Bryobacteraceae bacterium]|jgi:lysophospholipase L1-like esterase|nr:SGNH/GDSL hydrolase family protein [Bryobacteraceae bacterium]